MGKLNESKDNAVLVTMWLTGTSEQHLYLATTKIIDPDKFFVIFVDAFGNGISSSPSNSPSQPLEEFPVFDVADMVASQRRLVTEVFEIEKLHAVLGISMGGMQAFEWAVQHPNLVSRAIPVVGTPRPSSFDLLQWQTLSTLTEMTIACQCDRFAPIIVGLQLGQESPATIASRFSREEVLAGALEAEASRRDLSKSRQWNIYSQSRATQLHDVTRTFDGDMARAADAVEAEMLIVIGTGDRSVSPEPAREFAKLADAELLELNKDCGHFEPGCNPTIFTGVVKHFLERPLATGAN